MSVDPFIEAEEAAGHNLMNACCLLEVSRAAYYQRRKAVPSHRVLRKQGVGCGKRRVRRLMREAGLEGRCKKRWRTTTVADPYAEAALDLIRRHFGPGVEVDRRYVGDITYIATWEGWAYLATVIDLSSRRVVGWALADHMRTELVADALTMAFKNRSPEEGLIFHSDRGCQYTSADYGELARANGVVLSAGRKGECWYNAVAESFFATIKRELVDTRAWPTRAGLHRAVFDYIEGWYNVRRLHSSLDYCSPAEWEAIHRNADRQAA